MTFERSFDGSEPLRPELDGTHEERKATSTRVVSLGTMACPQCDAPVMPHGAVAPSAPIDCAFCGHAGRVRDFLSLGEPVRPARVEVRIVSGALTVRRSGR